MIRAWLVAQREFLENIRTKGFWFGIMMMPVMLVLIAAVPLLVESTRNPQQYVVVDHSGWLLDAVLQAIDQQDLVLYLKQPAEAGTRTPLDALKNQLTDMNDKQYQEVASRLLGNFSEEPGKTSSLTVAVLDRVGQQGTEIERWWRALDDDNRAALAPDVSSNRFRRQTGTSLDVDLDNLNQQVQAGSLFAYIVIGHDPVQSTDGFRFVSNNLTDRELLNWFSRVATSEVRNARLKKENIQAEIASWISEPISFEGLQISASGEEQQVDSEDVVRQWTPVVFVYLLWISILINTQMLLTNTIEEKSNKLIEVLLSSISPLVLMAGKILGIAATGLTIIAAWIGMAALFFLLIPHLVGFELPVDLASVAADPWFLGSFIVYFLLGYLLYAAILVGLGSVCNNLKEAQNLMLPVQLIQMLPILLMVPIGRDPNGTLAQVLSYIPPLTPFVMMNRAAGPPSNTEYLVTTLLLVLSIALALWVAAKVFRIGILLTGKPPGLLEVLRWLRAPVTQAAGTPP